MTYTYDELGRLRATSSTGSVNSGKTQSINYDAAGNRIDYSSFDPVTAPASLSIGDTSATEGGLLVFPVTRSGNLTSTVSVNFAAANGTAIAGSDFTAASGTLTFGANETTKTITIATIDDMANEETETMTVSLSGATGVGQLARETATGSIIDNDIGWGYLLTVGQATLMIDISPYGTIPITYTGYMPGLMGSISNTAYKSYSLTGVYTSFSQLQISMSGSTTPPNSGWTSITVPGLGVFNRSAASYSSAASGHANWIWTFSSGAIASGTVLIQ